MTTPGPVSFKSRRLAIHPFDEACVSDEYLSWLNDQEVMRFSNQRFRAHSRQSARDYIASFAGTTNVFLAVRLAESGRMIGTMTAYISNQHTTADMGILIGDRACWGQGYGLEAWTTLMHNLFASWGMRKVTGGAARPNMGMVRIMERSGMHLEAVRTRQEIIDGVEQDVLYYARFVDR
ncbi:MAG TPA: GNAT family N-acetyltransferase [Steroidobacteraceae bacterium]|jgi:RimJ/RimL family protein N-acetyltransferase